MAKIRSNNVEKQPRARRNWAAIGLGVVFSGHSSKKKAEECAKEKGIPKSDVRRLKDL